MENVTADVVKKLQAEGKKVLVDYYATWCGPCKVLIPKLEEIEKSYPNITFVKVNVDENMDHAKEMNIRGVPTVLIYQGDNLKDRSSGVQSDNHYKNVLDSL